MEFLGKYWDCVCNCLYGRRHPVQFSSGNQIISGVPQRSVLGPTLLLIVLTASQEWWTLGYRCSEMFMNYDKDGTKLAEVLSNLHMWLIHGKCVSMP